MSYRFADSLRAGSGRNWFRPDPVEFHSKNKFQKLVRLVGFIIRIYHDARSPERQICSAYWELLLSQDSVTHCRLTKGEKLQEHLERVYCFKTKTLVLQPEV